MSSTRRNADNFLEPRKVLVSLLLGGFGFAGAFYGYRFSVPPLTLTILWSYSFPLVAGMAYGARYGLIAGLFGGALYPFFIWPNNGWACAVTAGLVLAWFVWHGYCAKRRAIHPAIWNRPIVVQSVFAVIYALGTRYGYPVALRVNPPWWAPDALTILPVDVLDSVALKGTLNLFLAFFAALCALIIPEVRRLLRLPFSPAARSNGKIVLISISAALSLWAVLLIFNSIFIDLSFPVGALAVDTPYEIIALLMFLAAGLATGYVVARYVEMRWATEARFEEIFQKAAVGISHTNVNGCFLRVNQQLCALIGYSEAELLQLRFQDITHPDDLAADMAFNRQLLAGEVDTFYMEKRYRCKDGRYVWVNITVSLQRDAGGEPEYFIAVIEDITERRRAAQALRESETRYRSTFEQAAVGISHTSLAGNFLHVNIRLCEITGYPREVLLTMRYQDITHPDDLAEDAHLVEQLLAGEIETYQREKRYFHRSGALVWVNLTVSRVCGDEGMPCYFISVIEDITARKQAEESLARERILLRTVIDNLPDAVYVKDLALRKVLANRADLINMGIAAEAAALGKTDFEVFPYEVAAQFSRDDKAVLMRDAAVFDVEERLVRPGGEERWLQTSKMPLHDDQGRLVGLVGIGHDITERKRNEEALRKSNQHLLAVLEELRETQQRMVQQERLAAVGQLAAGIAHDFNNILAVIALYAEMTLQTPALAEPVVGRLRVILQQTRRAADLIQQIVDFSRRAVLERHPLDLLPFVKEQIKLLQRTLPENIHTELCAAEGAYVVHADPTRLQQTLLNLALNARDAMPLGGNLHIGLERLVFHAPEAAPYPALAPGAWVKLTVTDTGVGMAPETLAHLFEPFFTTKAPGKGTGLGLAQVQGIVKQHQGEIDVRTRLGEGATFTIYLPALSEQTLPAPAGDIAPLELGQGECILIVEDDPGVREALAHTLELMNYCPLQAAHGREALLLLEQRAGEVALVLSDFIMPELGGQALLETLRQRGFEQPVVMLSGYPLQGELAELQALGLSDWLLKPPDVERLARVLAQTLR